MKKFKYSILLASALMVSGALAAQNKSDEGTGWHLSLGGGYTTYYGDVSPYQIKQAADWKRAFRIFQYQQYYTPSPSFGLTLEKRITPGFGIMLQANRNVFAMSDRYAKNNGEYDFDVANWDRALNFRTDLWDAGLAFTFHMDNGKILSRKAFLAPYAYIGAGVSYFNVMGDLYDENGNRYDYSHKNTVPTLDYETNLRDHLTELDEAYSQFAPYVDLGLGLKFRISPTISFLLQTDIHYSFSDYLDDVSGRYKSSYPNFTSAYVAKPGASHYESPTMRGNDNGVNDFYIFNKLAIQFSFGTSKKNKFKAPVIYNPEHVVPYSQYEKTNEPELRDKERRGHRKFSGTRGQYGKYGKPFMKTRVYETKDFDKLDFDKLDLDVFVDSIIEDVLGKFLDDLDGVENIEKKVFKIDGNSNVENFIELFRGKIDTEKLEGQKLETIENEEEYELLMKEIKHLLNLGTVSDSLKPNRITAELLLDQDGKVKPQVKTYNLGNITVKSVADSLEVHRLDNADLKTGGETFIVEYIDPETGEINEKVMIMANDPQEASSGNDYKDRQDNKEYQELTYVIEYVDPETGEIKEEEMKMANEPQDTPMTSPGGIDYKDREGYEEAEAFKMTIKYIDPSTGDFTTEVKRVNSFEEMLKMYPNAKGFEEVIDPVTMQVEYTVILERTKTELQSIPTAPTKPFSINDGPVKVEMEAVDETLVHYEYLSNRLANIIQAQSDSVSYYQNHYNAATEEIERNNQNLEVLAGQIDSLESAKVIVEQSLAEEVELAKSDNWFKRVFTGQKKYESVDELDKNLVEINQMINQYAQERNTYDSELKRLNKEHKQLLKSKAKFEKKKAQYEAEAETVNANVQLLKGAKYFEDPDLNLAPVFVGPVYDQEEMDDDVQYIELMAEINTINEKLTALNNVQVVETKTTQPVVVPAPSYIVQDVDDARKVQALKDVLSKKDLEISKLEAEIATLKQVKPIETATTPVVAEKEESAITYPIVPIYFNTGSIAVDVQQADKLLSAVQYAHSHKDVVFVLKGFTDATGSVATNQRIAKQRVAAVKNLLINQYKIKAENIILDGEELSKGKGSNALNRRVDVQLRGK